MNRGKKEDLVCAGYEEKEGKLRYAEHGQGKWGRLSMQRINREKRKLQHVGLEQLKGCGELSMLGIKRKKKED